LNCGFTGYSWLYLLISVVATISKRLEQCIHFRRLLSSGLKLTNNSQGLFHSSILSPVMMKAAKAASSFFLPRMNDGASKRIGGSGEIPFDRVCSLQHRSSVFPVISLCDLNHILNASTMRENYAARISLPLLQPFTTAIGGSFQETRLLEKRLGI
jgi:hypothetical protein